MVVCGTCWWVNVGPGHIIVHLTIKRSVGQDNEVVVASLVVALILDWSHLEHVGGVPTVQVLRVHLLTVDKSRVVILYSLLDQSTTLGHVNLKGCSCN